MAKVKAKTRFKLTRDELVAIAEKLPAPNITDILPMVDHLDLPIAKRKILATKMLPQAMLWTEKRKAEYAQVSQRYWYTVCREPKFAQLCVEIVRSQIGTKVAEVWNAFLSNALFGDVQSQVIILREATALTKASKESGDTTVNVAIVQQERKDRLRVGLEQFNYAVTDPD